MQIQVNGHILKTQYHSHILKYFTHNMIHTILIWTYKHTGQEIRHLDKIKPNTISDEMDENIKQTIHFFCVKLAQK